MKRKKWESQRLGNPPPKDKGAYKHKREKMRETWVPCLPEAAPQSSTRDPDIPTLTIDSLSAVNTDEYYRQLREYMRTNPAITRNLYTQDYPLPSTLAAIREQGGARGSTTGRTSSNDPPAVDARRHAAYLFPSFMNVAVDRASGPDMTATQVMRQREMHLGRRAVREVPNYVPQADNAARMMLGLQSRRSLLELDYAGLETRVLSMYDAAVGMASFADAVARIGLRSSDLADALYFVEKVLKPHPDTGKPVASARFPRTVAGVEVTTVRTSRGGTEQKNEIDFTPKAEDRALRRFRRS